MSAADVPVKLHPDDATKLAVERTRAAYERTMLAWVRTGTSLITFGFGLAKFTEVAHTAAPEKFILDPQEFGLIMVSIGILSLTVAVVEHYRNIRSLGRAYEGRQRSTAVSVAALIALLGIAALFAMLHRA
ncbi:MAG TPA: DUF202 domain-containing protein [Candidatus Acidoferrales bacterium]|nr:DUF202 domain-containing protein [Candidatus Acidoferrales bacterium]